MKSWLVTLAIVLMCSSSAKAQAPTDGELAIQRELVELRAELKSLRHDIKELVQSLKPADAPTEAWRAPQPVTESSELLPNASPDKMYLPARAENPNREPRLELEERPFVDLTLEQCIEMALNNAHRPQQPEARAQSKAQITYETKNAFWQLWQLHREWESRMQLHISAFTLFENFHNDQQAPRDLVTQLQAWVGDTSPTANTYRHSHHTNIGDAILKQENQLRKQIGWAMASSDQPNIKPSVARVDLRLWQDSWESTLCRALENNPDLQSVRQALSRLQGSVAQHKDQPGYDKLAWLSVALAEKERQQTLNLQNELTFAWRLLDSLREQARIHRDHQLANKEEMRIYRERLLEGTGSLMANIDLLRRASERMDSATYQYWTSVAEYQKCYAQLEYLTDDLTKN